ncbi:MAG: 23S rRNA (adenine(2503)-C(2))-methyltransferase RlmN [Tepidisphaerales bacterium]
MTAAAPMPADPDAGLTVADHTPETFAAAMARRGWRVGRSRALLRTLYTGRTPRADRFGQPVAAWAMSLRRSPTAVVQRHVARDGTVKLLVGLDDGQAVECVLMDSDTPGLVSGCISSQVGCAMGCDFCASTLEGVKRDLTAAELVGQFFHLRDEAAASGRRLATLVLMGMGEPMLNLDAVIPALRRISTEDGAQFGSRNIQVSTVGIVPGIRQLAESGLRVQLALSLHGPDDATRSAIVPAGRKYTVAEVLDAAWAYQLATGRVTNIEYCLLADVNDTVEHARRLVVALAGRAMHVNLIPYNPIGAGLSGRAYQRPGKRAMVTFLQVLRDGGVVAHIRKTRGDDRDAACGQLRRRALPVLATRAPLPGPF